MSEVQCPNCQGKFSVEAIAHVPAEQQLTMRLEMSHDMIAARTLGESVLSMRKLLMAVAKDIGSNVEVMVHKVTMEGRTVEIGYTIVAVSSVEKRPAPQHSGDSTK